MASSEKAVGMRSNIFTLGGVSLFYFLSTVCINGGMEHEAWRTLVRGVVFGGSITATHTLSRLVGGRNPSTEDGPPAWIFPIAWSILYVTTGVAWALQNTGRADVPLGIVTALCCAWLPLYMVLGWRRIARLVLVITVLATVVAAVVVRGASGWLLTPLILWTSFAASISPPLTRTE